MRKAIALVSSLLLVATLATPAQSAGAKYSVYQKTLATFSSSATTLTTQQKAQVKATVEANPTAEKFICTGIRYYDQPMSVNITVRKRAKAACEYAKQLNPELSTWFQNKPTKARSYAGKVLLTVKTAQNTARPGQKVGSLEYPSCDSGSSQPLTRVDNKNWLTYSYDCPTDRQTPEEALAYNPQPSDLDQCKLIETSPGRARWEDLTAGFPASDHPYRLQDGNHRIAVIPVQWPDLKGELDIMQTLKPAAQKVDDWYETYSRGKVSFDWSFYDGWITLPDESENYSQSEAQQNTGQWSRENTSVIDYFWSSALKASDPFVDFTDVDMVFFILPTTQDVVAEFNLWPPGSGVFQTDEGQIERGYTPGNYHFRDGNEVWMFWIHEMLHYFKLPDLYWVDQNSVKRSAHTLPGPMQNFDILTNQGGITKSLNGWLMWLAGWAHDKEIYCLTPDNFKESSFEITTIDQTDESLKSVILKISETSAVVIESRRRTAFDSQLDQRSRDGVLVYHVNTAIGHGEGPLTILAPAGRTLIATLKGGGQKATALDAVLYEGNSIDIAGYHITVNQAKEFSDVVSVSKIEGWVPGSAPNYVCHTRPNRDLTTSYEFSCPIIY
jgi:M6 family metalloprotease-like protein